MTQTVCILGRQPALGLAELESLYGSDKLRPIGGVAAVLDIAPPKVDFSRLGGTVKFCKLLTVLDTTNWRDIQKFLEDAVPQHASSLPDGKMKLGMSVYGLNVSPQQINASGLALKKVIRRTGRSVRVVPNTEAALNSAQVLHNQLTGALGWELVFVRDGNKTILAQNIAEQDIEAYTARDQKRPKRDAKVGMLPPKLAQIIINLASGKSELTADRLQVTAKDQSCPPPQRQDKTILDPFCGTGVVLQEAALMGYDVYGTDLEPRMVDYSKANLDWLGETFPHPPFTYHIEAGDATNFLWPRPSDMAASELYLGQPLSTLPPAEKLEQIVQGANLIIKKFLKNLAYQTEPGYRVCLAVPAWAVPGSPLTTHSSQLFKHLPLLDSLTDMGYNRVSFVHASDEDLVYHREGQIVGRELVVLIRK
jgi:tRNA (guanine10-N2)-dimethyltransferase